VQNKEKIDKLMKFFKYHSNTAKLYVETKGKCEYCGIDLFTNILTYYSSDIDHILPKSKYQQLKDNDLNTALSCKICNQSKGRRDFLKKGEDPIIMLTENRQELINRVKEYVKIKRQEKENEYNEIKEIIQK